MTKKAEKGLKKKVPVPPLEKGGENKIFATIALSPSLSGAIVTKAFMGKMLPEADLVALVEVLEESARTVQGGDLRDCEAMLFSQAYALQTVFMSLSKRAVSETYLRHYETFMRLALKAQGQCRATLETLATIKNPPTVFARQANIAHGPQQVNNGTLEQAPARASNLISEPIEQLED